MKTTKIFLLALLAFASIECFSQNYGDYGDDEYLERICFPSAFSTCRSISLSGDLDANAYLSPNANALFRPIMSAGDTVTDIEPILVIRLQDCQVSLFWVCLGLIVIRLCL